MSEKSGELVGRELLLEVACDLFMKAGYDGVSMQQIADAAHMTKGSPYYHFEGKEDLFVQALVNRTKQINEGFVRELGRSADLRSRLTGALTYLIVTADVGMIRLFEDFHRCVGEERVRQFKSHKLEPAEMVAALTPIFAEAARTGTPLRATPERAATIFFALQMGMLHTLHLLDRTPKTPGEASAVAAETVDCFLDGLVAPVHPAAE